MVAEIVDLDDSGYVDFQAAVWVSWEQERRVLVRREKFFHVFFHVLVGFPTFWWEKREDLGRWNSTTVLICCSQRHPPSPGRACVGIPDVHAPLPRP